MKCKVILAFGTYRVGDIIEPSGLYRDELKSRGFIQPVVELPKQPEPKQQYVNRKRKNVG